MQSPVVLVVPVVPAACVAVGVPITAPVAASVCASSCALLRRSLRAITLGTSFAVAVGAASACADEPPAIGAPSPLAAPARTLAPPPPPAVMDAQPPELPALDVAGRLVDDAETAVVGRPLTLVDQHGRRQELLTDEDGGFRATRVAPPYDLLVEAAPSGAVTTPLAFLGLGRADPRLEVFERQGPAAHAEPQPIRVDVKLPPCRSADVGCWVSVVTSSPSGGGGTAGSYTASTESAVFDVEHAFRAAVVSANETIDVHVLVGDADYTQYAYAHLDHVAARPGEPMDALSLSPAPVPSSEPVSVAAGSTGAPDGWDWTLASELEMSGGAVVALRYEWSSSSSMRLPLLPGATWHVGAWIQHPPTPDRPWFHRSAQVWSGALPLATTDVALDVPAVPEPVRPEIEGTLSRRARALVWGARGPSLASVVVVDLATGQQRFRALTTDAEVSLRRLEALGLRRLEQGAHVLDLTTTPGATVDELTDPDVRGRLDRFDVHVAGATTYQRFRFVVTP